ncbi:MAG: PQQ-binding-like beta-propeller repeat protein [Planctomycetes bacterium]|nr:PQQ-binding-like beta-propeller repeat protein [Planctomycetota bacterium]
MKQVFQRVSVVGIVAVWMIQVAWTSADTARAADWPMWRHDPGRSACTDEELAPQLHLQWSRQLPRLEPTWPDQNQYLKGDGVYEPIVGGGTLFVASPRNDSLTAYDLATGEQRWRFFAEAPIRFAPVFYKGRVYFTADDGCLYCVDASTGRLVRKIQTVPDQRKVLGNRRLISAWPSRGAPVLKDGTLYFASSIWPFMGVFIYAVDAETFQIEWLNDETGPMWTVQPHNSPAFGGLAPQGYLAATSERLIVPNGRAVPACLDRQTGKLIYFRHALRFSPPSDLKVVHALAGKYHGGYRVAANDHVFFCEWQGFDLKSGRAMWPLPGHLPPVLAGDRAYIGSKEGVYAYTAHPGVRERRDKKGRSLTVLDMRRLAEWKGSAAETPLDIFLKAGERLYAGRSNEVLVIDIRQSSAENRLVVSWRNRIEGTPATMLAADGRLLVVTTEGRLLCFGPKKRTRHEFPQQQTPSTAGRKTDQVSAAVAALLDAANVRDGYAVVLGLRGGGLVQELLRQSKLHVIGVDERVERVDAIRRRLDELGLYGPRAAMHVGEPLDFGFPPYFASLVVSEDIKAAGITNIDRFVREVFRVLRPYGGSVYVQLSPDQHERLERAVAAAGLERAEVTRHGEWTVLRRVGALPGAGSWTHQYADAANSVVSQDRRVKPPLGLLWFGGPSNQEILPRHGHGPNPQVAGGRLVIEGADVLRAVDVYTGRVLWEKQLPGLGLYYDRTDHYPGAGQIGSNYVTLPDRVYVVYGPQILVLDAATGETVRKIPAPAEPDGGRSVWGFLAVAEDVLIATAKPVAVLEEEQKYGRPLGKPRTSRARRDGELIPARYTPRSQRLIAMNRHTGKTLWARTARLAFRHNCVILGGGRVYCIDGLSRLARETLRRRGVRKLPPSRLLALDARTGRELWTTDSNVFGTFLSYSAEHDLLVMGTSKYRDRAKDEADSGLAVYAAATGELKWRKADLKYYGPVLLWRDRIITNGEKGYQIDLRTGQRIPWHYSRMYGCNTIVGSQSLLTFRSAAAAFCDLTGDSGTANLGGFKSSCTSNLIIADGLLNAPDYTRTCDCGYQNQASLALVPMPDVEVWSFNDRKWDEFFLPPTGVGLNLGAPGDRRAANGTLWLEYPVVEAPSEKKPVRCPSLPIEVRVEPRQVKWFYDHSLWYRGSADAPAWIGSSGAVGLKSLRLSLRTLKLPPGLYTVRLCFAEPQPLRPGQRRFSVSVQGEQVLRDFDIVAEAGGSRRTVTKEIANVRIDEELRLTLTSRTPDYPPVLSGVEIRPSATSLSQ